ncbi:MAG TPA: hypothetical protein VKY44_05875 [Flavobacterium sp.]|nr:hypothetical protein [Flavobacterium sp.]
MGVVYNENINHFNYYLAVESDLINTFRYVECSKSNDNTFSVEFARIIMTSTQEIDGLFKEIFRLIDPDSNPKNIGKYKKLVLKHLPDLVEEKIYASKYGIELTPWINWCSDSNPDWWRANNDIKHERLSNFDKANLKNALNSVAALYCVNMYYLKVLKEQEEGEALDWPEVFMWLPSKNELFRLESNKHHAW